MEELIQLCPVPTQIISPRDSKPITAVVQDVATGLFRLTKNHVRMNERQFMNLMANVTKFDGDMPKPYDERGYNGRQALSMILPERLNVDMKADAYEDNLPAEMKDNLHVVVRNGEVVSGAFFKDVYQRRTAGIVHTIFNEYGPDETRQLYDNTQRLICDWFIYDGFSTGISDIMIPERVQNELKSITHNMKVEAYNVIRQVHEGKFVNNSTKSDNDLFEEIVNNKLNKANGEVGSKALAQVSDRTNRLLNMIKSKSKGQPINFAQMVGCLGQQNVEGRRIPYGFEDRTLPHYTKYDDGPESRGFVESSFIKGLTPQEFFFHAMGGREGLIDTAVNSVTGDTPIVIIEDNKPKYVKIGDWIDAYLDDPKNKNNIKYIPEQANLEMMNMEVPVYIPTTDAHGKVSWGELTAVTRHDPGERLYEIITDGGRSVIVAESKSLLVWDETSQSFIMKHSPEVKIGDFAPVTIRLPSPPLTLEFIDMAEYCFTNEHTHPDKLVLDKQFGMLVGLYIANGSVCTETGHVNFANLMDWEVNDCVHSWFAKYNISSWEDASSITGNYSLLAKFFDKCVGNDANNKIVPDVAFAAPEQFVLGLLNGYKLGSVVSQYASGRLKEGIALLRSRIGELSTENLQKNDVMLDAIKDIKVLGVDKYPKLYDVTVPSTLNFMIHNGLQVVDKLCLQQRV